MWQNKLNFFLIMKSLQPYGEYDKKNIIWVE